jgi:hypothetical protein
MNFTIRLVYPDVHIEEIIPADKIEVFTAGHTNPHVPPEGGLVYFANGKEGLIHDGIAYVMNTQGKTVAKYNFTM